MNTLSEAEVAWLAGIYEGEGNCSIRTGRNFRVEIAMTDEDVMQHLYQIVGIGSIKLYPARGAYKPVTRWSVGGKEAVLFLEKILPWLGCRRSERATQAIQNWLSNRSKSTRHDDSCIHGHTYETPNYRRKDGSCHFCGLEASRRHRERKRLASNH